MSVTDRELRLGDMAGEYRIVSHLGSGAYGDVFAGVQPTIGKHVAIKVLRPEFSEVKPIVSRFISEARAVNQIAHRNIVDIFSFGTLDDGRLYLVMELLRGKDLEALIGDEGRMSSSETLALLAPVAAALDAAHATGVVHRDVKPENIFICFDQDGPREPKLLDFGVAKLLTTTTDHKTATGIPIGTPLYMSPEQCRGAKDIDHRSDIYSLGVVAYRMLTGGLPFDSDDVMDLLIQHTSEMPRRMSAVFSQIPPDADEAVARMLAKNPADRPPSAGVAIAALVAAFGEGTQPSVDVASTRAEPRHSHHPTFTTSAVLTAEFLALGGPTPEPPSLDESAASPLASAPPTSAGGGGSTLASADYGAVVGPLVEGITHNAGPARVAIVGAPPDVTHASPGNLEQHAPGSRAPGVGGPSPERGASWNDDLRESGAPSVSRAGAGLESGSPSVVSARAGGGSRRWLWLVGGLAVLALAVGGWAWSSRRVVDDEDETEPDEPGQRPVPGSNAATVPTAGVVVEQTARRTLVATSIGPAVNEVEAFARRVTVLTTDESGIERVLVTFESHQAGIFGATSAIVRNQVYVVERQQGLIVTKPGDSPVKADERADVVKAMDDVFDPGAFGVFPPSKQLSANEEIELSPVTVGALAGVGPAYRGLQGSAVFRGRSKGGLRFDVTLELASKGRKLSLKGRVVSAGPGGWTLLRELDGVVNDNGETSPMTVRSTSRVVPAEDTVTLRQKSSARCVTVADASERKLALVVTEACERAARHQRFRRIPVGDGRLLLMAEHSGMCLDIEAGSLAPLAPLIQHPCHAQENQQFRFGDDHAVRVVKSGLCLDEGGASGREIIQQGCSQDAAQTFSFE